MDLTRAITYRGFALNNIKFDGQTRDLVGCEVTSVEYGNVPAAGYDEKRALADGHDASDIFLGKRTITLTGVVYGRTRNEAFRLWSTLSEIMLPTAAYDDEPDHRGYVPLDFYRPTDSLTKYPTGLVHQMIFARPRAGLISRFESDRHGGEDNKGLAIPWSVVLEARVPYVVNYDYTSIPVSGAASGAGNFLNRGNRPAVIEVYLAVPVQFNGVNEGHFQLWISGTLSNRIIIPSTGVTSYFRYNTHDKVLAYRRGTGGEWNLRMDLLSAGSKHKNLPAGSHAYKWWREGTKTLAGGSYVRFRDTFA